MEVAGVSHHHVSLGEVRMHVAEAGDGPPLVLLHGWPQHWWAWRRLIPQLATRHRVLAPDLRGWGWSSAPPGDYAKATFATDILRLLDHQRIERVALIGHDWGGYAAFLLALARPDRIERVVALDIAPPWRGALRPRHLALPLTASYQALLAAPGIGPRLMTGGNRFVRTIIRAGSGRRMQWSNQELDVYAQVLRDPARAQATTACYRTFLLREVPALVTGGYSPSDLRVPALLVLGAESPLARVLDPRPGPNLRVEKVPGAGHFLPEEAPDQVLGLTESFLNGDGR